MEYTIIIDGRSYDLPKKRLSVMVTMDDVMKVDSVKGYSVRQKFEKIHRFIKDLVGDDNAKEILGSDNISEIDLSEVTLTAKKIIDAYDKPITDYDLEKSMRKIEGIPIDKIVSVANAAEKIVKMPQQK